MIDMLCSMCTDTQRRDKMGANVLVIVTMRRIAIHEVSAAPNCNMIHKYFGESAYRFNKKFPNRPMGFHSLARVFAFVVVVVAVLSLIVFVKKHASFFGSRKKKTNSFLCCIKTTLIYVYGGDPNKKGNLSPSSSCTQ